MFLGEFFKNYFYANSLNQIKPDIIMSGLALRPRHARIQLGGGERGGLEKYSWSGSLKNHKATFLCMTNIRTLAKRHLNGVSLAGR